MAEFRAALIGFGLAGSLFHGPLIAATPEISRDRRHRGRNRASQASRASGSQSRAARGGGLGARR